MILDLGSVIDDEAVEVTLRQKSGGAYDADGRWAGETIADTPILAVVQPARGAQLADLPEGERSTARWLLWSRASLRLDDEIVQDDGVVFRVVHVWPRREGGFTRAAMGLKPT